MNFITRTFTALALAAALFVGAASAQTALVQTTLSAAITSTDNKLTVASATGITAAVGGTPTIYLWVVDPGEVLGELIAVKTVSGTTIGVTRSGQFVRAHVSGAVVIVGPPAAFPTRSPHGACTAASTAYTPWIDTVTGLEWLCSTKTLSWVPGWGNNSAPVGRTADVASAAGTTLPSGPLFVTSGTNAITGWTLPVGFNGGSFTTIFSGAATWTAAGNIALASLEAMTANCAVTFTWEVVAAKWYPNTLTCAPTP